MSRVTFRGSRRELIGLLHSLPAILAGTTADPNGVVQQLMMRIGVAALSQVQQDFIRKSRGGTGKDGITWAPLRPATIARRLAKERRLSRRRRGKSKAAMHAGKIDIGRDTGRMLASLSPGVEDRPSGAPGQVFRTATGTVTVGTMVPYAQRFHSGGSNPYQVARPLWPEDGTIPDAWWPAIYRAAARGVAVAIRDAITRGARR